MGPCHRILDVVLIHIREYVILHHESPSVAVGYDFRWRRRPVNILSNSLCRIKQGITSEKVFHCALCTISQAATEVIYVLAQLKYSENESKKAKKKKRK